MIVAAAVLVLIGSAIVTDGDTLKLNDGTRTISVRIFGIDAPEARQLCTLKSGVEYSCGDRATLFLAGAVYGRTLECEPKDVDRYGRTVAVCSAAGIDLGRAMVNSGLAIAYRAFSMRYVEDEARAKRARRGLWAGRFAPPAEFRANRFR
jgi:endonuclease YncB( thermonuclease family)